MCITRCDNLFLAIVQPETSKPTKTPLACLREREAPNLNILSHLQATARYTEPLRPTLHCSSPRLEALLQVIARYTCEPAAHGRPPATYHAGCAPLATVARPMPLFLSYRFRGPLDV